MNTTRPDNAPFGCCAAAAIGPNFGVAGIGNTWIRSGETADSGVDALGCHVMFSFAGLSAGSSWADTSLHAKSVLAQMQIRRRIILIFSRFERCGNANCVAA